MRWVTTSCLPLPAGQFCTLGFGVSIAIMGKELLGQVIFARLTMSHRDGTVQLALMNILEGALAMALVDNRTQEQARQGPLGQIRRRPGTLVVPEGPVLRVHRVEVAHPAVIVVGMLGQNRRKVAARFHSVTVQV
jgi:hypothetical protein